MKRFLILLAVVVLSSSQDWDYRKAGRDWTNTQCLTGTQAPLKFSLADTKPLDKKYYYFFPTTNKNVKAKLQHEKNGNHLVLNFTEMGSVLGQANYQDDWGEHTQNCTAIFFKIPGEHIFENERGDMELQLNCSKFEQAILASTFISIPVKATDDEKEQSIFFNSLQKIVDEKIDETKLPIEISVDTFGDLMDGFSVFDGAYIYDAQLNFPPCDVSVNYVYIHRLLKISKTLLEQLKVSGRVIE